MKFKIRFADQIVGFFIIAALVVLVFVVIMLGTSQRWFAKDESFVTQFSSAQGLSKNMPIQYKGFIIGNVQSFSLNSNNNVDVVFLIHEEYLDRVKRGSTVELIASPIGLGNQFVFHAGKGSTQLNEGDFIPAWGTPEARELVFLGLAEEPSGDAISTLLSTLPEVLNNVNVVLADVSSIITTLDDALVGNKETELGQIIGGVNSLVAGMPGSIVNPIIREIDSLLNDLNPIIKNITALTAQFNDPDIDTIHTILGDGEIYDSLVSSLASVSGTLDSLDKAVALLESQLPQLTIVFAQLPAILKSVDDVLIAVANNPLLRGGVPQRANVQSSGTSPRDISF